MELFNEFISILITILAVIYTFSTLAKTAARARRSKRTAEDDDLFEEAGEEEEFFEEFETAEQPVVPQAIKSPPPPRPLADTEKSYNQRPVGDFDFHSKLDDFTQTTSIDDRALEIGIRPGSELGSDAFRLAQTEGAVMKRPSKASIKQLIKSLPEEQLLFLSYEVFHVPVSKRPSPFPWNG